MSFWKINDSAEALDVVKRDRSKCISLKDADPVYYKNRINNHKLHDANFATLTTTLAKLLPELVEPITSTTYQNDIDVEVGGGFVEMVTYYSVDWYGIVKNTLNMAGNNTNIAPRVNASLRQHKAEVYTWEIAYDLRFIDLEKMKKLELTKSITDIYKDIIVANFDIFCETIAYVGKEGGSGLFNNPNVKVYNVASKSALTNADETVAIPAICSFINGIFQAVLTETGFNRNMLPDHILVPTWLGSKMSSIRSDLFTSNLRAFLENFNYGKDESIEPDNFKLVIRSRAQLDNLGNNGLGRVVAYPKNRKFVRMDMTYPLNMFYTGPNTERASYTTFFVGQISEVQLPYNTDSANYGAVTYWEFNA